MINYKGGTFLREVKLPLSTPLSKAYLHNAYQLSILGCKKETETWIFMNYIQFVAESGKHINPVTFYLPDYTGYNWSILSPWFNYSVLTRELIVELRIDFKTFIRNAFSQKQYVFLYVNEKYLPGTTAHLEGFDLNHHVLLHGYNYDFEEVFFLTYDKDNLLSERTVKIKDLEDAYYNNIYDYDNENKMYLLKLREDEGFKLKFEIEYVLVQLECLRDEKRVINNVLDYHEDIKYTYGLAVYGNIINNLQLFISGTFNEVNEMLVIPLHLVMEHKQIMVERLKFISKHYQGTNLYEFIDSYIEYKSNFESLRNQALMYKFTGDKTILLGIINCILEVKKREKETLTKLIEHLSSFAINGNSVFNE